MKNKYFTGALVICACAIMIVTFANLAASAGKAPAAPAMKADAPRDFDDWRLLCETPAGGKKECQVFQRILFGKDKAAQGDAQVALTTVLHLQEVKDKQVTGVRLITPLGTILTPGIALKIDEEKELKIPYTQCLQAGCVIDMVFDQPMLDKMRAGKIMLVAYRMPNGQDNTLKISLKGLAPALDALAKTAAKG